MSIDHPKNELYDDFVLMVDKVSSAVIKETTKPIADQIRVVTEAMDKTSQVLRKSSSEIDKISEGFEGNLKVTAAATGQKINEAVTQLKHENAQLKTHVSHVGDGIHQRIENDIKPMLDQNFSLIGKKVEALREQNKLLQIYVQRFQKKQEKILYWILGLGGFFGVSILAIVVFMLHGMK